MTENIARHGEITKKTNSENGVAYEHGISGGKKAAVLPRTLINGEINNQAGDGERSAAQRGDNISEEEMKIMWRHQTVAAISIKSV